MRLQTVATAVVFGLLVSNLTACTPPDDKHGGGRLVTQDAPPTNKENCTLQPEDGPAALTDKLAIREVVTSDYFGKKYDRSMLEGVLNASAISTTSYVKSMGVSLFKIEPTQQTDKECLTYYNLSTADKDHKDVWDDASKDITDSKAHLAGLYFEYCGVTGLPDCKPREMVQPTILLYESMDRWTIVHEMMHHNFNMARKLDLDTPTTAELKAQYKDSGAKAQDLLDQYKVNASQDLGQRLSSELGKFSQILYQRLIRGDLEEIAVEGTLVEEWSAGHLQLVAKSSAQNAAWYINYSKDKSLDSYSPIEKAANNLVADAKANKWTDVEKNAQDVLDYINSMKQDLAEKAQAARQSTGYSDSLFIGENDSTKLITAAMVALTQSHSDFLDRDFATPDVQDIEAGFSQSVQNLIAR